MSAEAVAQAGVPDRVHTSHDLDAACVTTIRTLCMDAVQAANSGHPGTPMGMAPVVYTLWQRFLRFDPADPIWPNRDRFVLSAGHASTLLYSLLHLTGVRAVNPAYETLGEPSVKLEDLEGFRQLDSKCPGHPEYRWTSGVECTTGPLGTGAATSVGMAIAARWQAAYFNRPEFTLFDYDTFAMCGDGDLMEGVSGEAASLAGHLKLANLCWVYDNNHITIEGDTGLAFTEDVATRFIGYGWHVTRVGDANDLEMLTRAFNVFERERDRPTLIIVDSHIGYGAPTKEGTAQAHGEPLGEEEVRATKRFYGVPEDLTFHVPQGIYEHFAAGIGARGREGRDAWMATFDKYRAQYPELAEQLYAMQHGSCRRAGTRRSPRSPPTPRARRPGTPPVRCSTPWPSGYRGCSAVPRTCRRPPRPGSPSTAPATSNPTVARGPRRPGATCTSACGSSSPRRSATGCRCRRSGRSGRRSSSSPTSRAARSGCPR